MSDEKTMRSALLLGSIGMVLAACGGGGSNSRPDPPPASTPSPAPTPAPAPAPSIPQPGVGSHLSNSGADAAHAAGLSGAGYAIGIIDSGVNRNHPALQGRVLLNNAYISGSTNNLRVDDVVGHGTTVAQLAAGQAVGSWPGGIAPGATILSARIIADKAPTDDGSGQGNEVDGALGLMGVHNDLIRAGMRIMNNSWGGVYWNNPNATAPIASEYRPFISNYDGLVVFAAGNESRANPTDMAALPSQVGPNGTMPAADLEKGWLTVVAVNADDPHVLSHYSNSCGVAASYCLAAQGTSVFIDADATTANGNRDMYYGSGTSYAAPLVSGAAALVWEAFPYFSNDQVRRTLLGTATDIGETGVDAVFGHGLLNIALATWGPQRLDLGDFDVDLGGRDSTWRNALSGDGGVTKRGLGTLTLSSNANANSGATRVLGGTLVANSLGYGQAVIGSGARLLARGAVGGSIDNAGILELDAGGLELIRVGGDYVQHAGSQLALQVGDVLSVAGTATLHGGELKVLGKRDYVSLGEKRQVIEAFGGLTGQFSGLTSPSSLFVEGSFDYTANGVTLTLNRLDVQAASAGLAGISAAGLASAERLEQAFERIDAGLADGNQRPADEVLQAAGQFQALTNAAQARASLDSLAGRVHGQALAASAEMLGNERSQLAQRLAAGQAAGSWRTRMNASVGEGWHSQGWLQGQGLSFGQGLQGGFAFGQGQLASAQSDAGRGQDRQTQAHLWLGAQRGDAYALAMASRARVDRELSRNLMLGQWQGGAQARYALGIDSLGVEAGLQLGSGRAGLQPHLGLVHEQLRSDGFAERDALGFGLQGRSLDARRQLGVAGLRSQWEAAGWQWQGLAQWQQLLWHEGLDWQARFTGFDAWSGLDMGGLQRSHGRLSLGVQRRLGGGVLSLQMDQRVSGTDPGAAASLQWWGRF